MSTSKSNHSSQKIVSRRLLGPVGKPDVVVALLVVAELLDHLVEQYFKSIDSYPIMELLLITI